MPATIARFVLLEARRSGLPWLVAASVAAGVGLAAFLSQVAVTESLALQAAIVAALLRAAAGLTFASVPGVEQLPVFWWLVALGAATAHARHGRLPVAIGGDGDFMFSPGVMWAAAHNRIPLLYIIHNNRAYFNEIMALQRIANRRGRGIDRTGIGNDLTQPVVDYAALAKSMGVAAFGPVTDPKELASVFKQAIAIVKKGEPVLVDVVAQGR